MLCVLSCCLLCALELLLLFLSVFQWRRYVVAKQCICTACILEYENKNYVNNRTMLLPGSV